MNQPYPEFEVIACTSEEAWLAARLRGISGTDAPALWAREIAELTGGEETYDWGSPYSVWCEKARLTQATHFTTERMKWGHKLEPVIAATYAEETGRAVIDLGRNALLVNRERPHLIVTLDRLIAAIDERGPGVLECKNVDGRLLNTWNDGPPQRVRVQVLHQLAVTGLQWGVAAACIGGNSFLCYPIERDEEWIGLHLDKVDELWERVRRVAELRARIADPIELEHAIQEMGIAPPTDGSDATATAIERRFREHQARFKKLPEDAEQAERLRAVHAQLKDARAAVRDAGKLKDEAENYLKDFIGDALGVEGLVQWQIDGEGRVNWKGVAADLLQSLVALASSPEQAAVLEAWGAALADASRGEPQKKLVDYKPPKPPRKSKSQQ